MPADSHEDKSSISGAWLVLAAAMLWGTTGTAQTFAPAGSTPAQIGALRLALGGALLLAWALWRGELRFSKDAPRWPLWATLAAAASMAAYQLGFFAGVARAGVALGTMVGIGSSPILAGLIGFLVRGERPTRTWGFATALAIAGCALLLGSGGSLRVDVGGVLLAVGAGAAYALFTVVSKGLLERHPPEAVMAVSFCGGALLLSPLLLGADLGWLAQPSGWGVALHLGAVTVALAYSLFAHGLQRVPVATAATLTLAEPLTAGMLGVFLLGERLAPQAWLGVGLIFVGLGVIAQKSK